MKQGRSFVGICSCVFAFQGCGGDAADSGVDAQAGSSVWEQLSGVSMTAVSSQIVSVVPQSARLPGEDGGTGGGAADYYIQPSASVCTDVWIDFDCDVDFPLFPPENNCPGDLRIDYSPDVSCPVCVDPPVSEPTCAEVRRRYLEFLDHNLRETCTSWCETASDCVLWEVDACGIKIDFAFRALVDEEPLSFAESFDIDNCAVCDGEPTYDQSISEELQLLCEDNQCVIQPID